MSILLTVLDSWAVVAFGGTLYRVSAQNPVFLTGIVLHFVALFASLARTWYLALPVRPRSPPTRPTQFSKRGELYVPQPGKNVRL